MKVMSITLFATATLALAACQQARGPEPVVTSQSAASALPVAQALRAVARKDGNAREALKMALESLSPRVPPELNAQLATELDQGLAGQTPSDEAMRELSSTLVLAFTSDELNALQTGELQGDLLEKLQEAGVADSHRAGIIGTVGRIQLATTRNPRRWYQIFRPPQA